MKGIYEQLSIACSVGISRDPYVSVSRRSPSNALSAQSGSAWKRQLHTSNNRVNLIEREIFTAACAGRPCVLSAVWSHLPSGGATESVTGNITINRSSPKPPDVPSLKNFTSVQRA